MLVVGSFTAFVKHTRLAFIPGPLNEVVVSDFMVYTPKHNVVTTSVAGLQVDGRCLDMCFQIKWPGTTERAILSIWWRRATFTAPLCTFDLFPFVILQGLSGSPSCSSSFQHYFLSTKFRLTEIRSTEIMQTPRVLLVHSNESFQKVVHPVE